MQRQRSAIHQPPDKVPGIEMLSKAVFRPDQARLPQDRPIAQARPKDCAVHISFAVSHHAQQQSGGSQGSQLRFCNPFLEFAAR